MLNNLNSTPTQTRAKVTAIANGTWLLTPQKMTIDILAIGLSKEGEDPQTGLVNVDNCYVTYDSSLPSLSKLLDCKVTLPVGTFVKIAIKFKDTYHVYFN